MSSADIGDDSIPNDGGDKYEKHDSSAKFQSIRNDGDDNCDNRCNGVWDHRPELGFVCCVSEFDDDGRKEEAE